MRLEQQQLEPQPQPQSTPASEPEPRYVQVEGEPFYRQIEGIDQQTRIIDMARRLGVEEQQARYP